MSRRIHDQVDPLVTLLDWKRRVNALYASVRADDDPQRAWRGWKEGRDLLFRTHPQSPIPEAQRASFPGLKYYDYDPEARVEGTFEALEEPAFQVEVSTGETQELKRPGRILFDLGGSTRSLDLLWVTGYGGGALLVFTDTTSAQSTYGGGRYLLDTIKGADLGSTSGGDFILDFNFAYNPSCSYDPRWSCPLAPPGNRVDVAIEAGEQHS